MSNFNDLMIDIETFGTGYNGMVVQVAMAYFDRHTAQIGNSTIINIDVNDLQQYGFTADEETLDFWAKQPKEIFESLQVNPFSCKDAVDNIFKFISYKSIIWSHSTFDVPLLSNFIQKVSESKKLPWGFRDCRDIRTLVDLSGLDLDKYNWDNEKTHNALSDVLFQIKYCTDAFNMLKYHCSQDEAIKVRETIEQQLAK